MFLNTVEEHFECSMYTLNYHLLDHTVKDMRITKTLYLSDISAYEHFNEEIKQVYKRPSQKRRTRMTQAIIVLKQSYERALSYTTM